MPPLPPSPPSRKSSPTASPLDGPGSGGAGGVSTRFAPRLLWRRVTGSVPLLITVIVHAVAIVGAGIFVVQERVAGAKKTFEAPPPADTTVQRQVEHRLQVARKGGGAPSRSPVSVQRISATAADALALPPLPELPNPGASLVGGGFGGMAAGIGLGAGSGVGTSLGNGGLGGRGFMSLSFLGVTTQKTQKVVFAVDVGADLVDIRKGGFQAFAIIREEIMKLVGRLPPGAEFGVVLFEDGQASINLYAPTLLPATVANKEAFFAWMKPVNADPRRIGPGSAPRRLAWTPKPLPEAGLDPALRPPAWATALHAALEMKPDTVFIITGNQGRLQKRVAESEVAARVRKQEAGTAKLLKEGIDLEVVADARAAALAKAREELAEVNAKLAARGRDPLLVRDTRRIFAADFQAELRKAGFGPIRLDTTGWTDKKGRPIWGQGAPTGSGTVPYGELLAHLARLQKAFLREPASVHVFLFTGPREKPAAAIDRLTQVSRRNGGRFELLTAERLEALAGR